MKLLGTLRAMKASRIYLDANCFIYALEGYPAFNIRPLAKVIPATSGILL